MAPNVVDTVTEEFQKLDLKQLAHEKGNYLVFPETKYPELEHFEHKDVGLKADPKKASLYDNAEKIFDVTPHIGTEVHGIQLSQLTDQQKDDLALLVAERGVVFFRKQDIDVHQAIELGKHYGPLHVHNTFGHPPTLPEIHVVYFDTETPKKFFDSRSASHGWHTDVSYEEQPAGLTFLKIDTLPAVGGDTLWSSGYAAYDRLSPAFQKFVEGLEAVHTGQGQVNEAIALGKTVRRKHVESVHPVVRTHPVTGWKSLYVQPVFTKHIVGLTKEESDAVLKHLYNHITGGVDFQVRLRWEEDTVAVWDNRVTNHNAIFDYLEIGKRHGWRVTPQAEKPYFDPSSRSKKEAKHTVTGKTQ
ncbi:hypothetical protein DFQ28_009011 [Apophysomyces sp. BC1034]|nr:hypothetical protein DFQ30_007566 [Apophysomyces sp. BC1015]KAG0176233.1 hypothetical protein DFQ29_006392 [Apophysomyces sp. BC1021]KAG0185669.1 hypothetical protein DFQ28_009011 [Apophysomyces sp. BC1034]